MTQTIELNGEKYIPEEDYLALKKDFNELLNKPKGEILSFPITELVLDDSNVLALGTANLGEGYNVVKFNAEYIERIIRVFRQFHDKKTGSLNLNFAYCKDMPLMIGRKSKEGGTMVGLILAPMAETS